MKLLIFTILFVQTLSSYAQQGSAALRKGNELYRLQQYGLAEEQYKAALEKAPDNSIAFYNLANALYRQKKWAEAHGVLKKLNAASVENDLKATAFYNNGVIYTKESSLDQSIEAYKAALRLKPDDRQARENLQKALTEQKKRQQQKQEQERKQQKSSRLSQREAEQRLKLLQEREKQLQERLQQGGQKGQSMPKDW